MKGFIVVDRDEPIEEALDSYDHSRIPQTLGEARNDSANGPNADVYYIEALLVNDEIETINGHKCV